MNKIFKVIYSKTRHCYVVVSELAKNQGKSEKSKHGMKRHNHFYRLAAITALIISAGSLLYPMQAEAVTDLSTNDYFTAYDKNYFDKDGKKSKDWTNVKPSNTDQDEANVGAKGTGAIAAGMFAQAGQQTVTIGDRNAGMSMGSVFIGEYKGYNNPTGNQPQGLGNNYVTSVGFMSNATKYGTIAIGAGASAEGEDNDVNFGNKDSSGTLVSSLPDPDKLKIKGASVSLGYSAKSAAGNIAIGSYSDATAETDAKAKTAYTDKAAASSYVSVGSDKIQRRITNVADGAAESDVATVGQLQTLSKKLGGYKAGFGIQIAPDSTDENKNVISLKHNLGTGYTDDDAKGLILGGSIKDRNADKKYGAANDSSVIVGAGNALASGQSSVVTGGLDNVASGDNSIASGGDNNGAIGNQSAVFGGRDNTATGIAATASGGIMNAAIGQQASALGGSYNYALGVGSTSVGGLGREYGNDGKVSYDSAVNGNYSVSIAGGSTGKDATGALAAGHQAVVTTANGTAIGYQATTNKAGTIAFGHDAGDVSGYTINWKQLPKGQINADGTTNDYTQAPESVTENTYKSAAYNRLVKVADGQDDHDVVVMKQLKQYAAKNASNIGNNVTVDPIYTKDTTSGKDVLDQKATEAAQKKAQKDSKDVWGLALGAGTFTTGTSDKATDASTSDQLVTGKTLYNYDKPTGTLNYVSANNTTGQNLSALDAQVAANAQALQGKTHNIKYYSVNEDLLPKVDGYSNEDNDGAKGMGSIAAGFNTHADGIASTVTGSYSGVLNQNGNGGLDLRGATALSYGTFNINQNTDAAKSYSGVANSIVGQANVTTNSNAAIIYGAGNTVTNSYRAIDASKFDLNKIKDDIAKKDATAVAKDLQDAVTTSGGQVMVMGGGNSVDNAYMTQVTGVGNTIKGNQVQNTKGEWVADTSDTAIKDYDAEKSSQYNYVDGFNNTVINGKHDYIIGANNTITGDSYDDTKVLPIKRSNKSNIVIGDNHTLTREQNTVIIGSSDTANTVTRANDAVVIGHNANADNDTGADNAVAIGRSAKANGGNAVTIGVNTSAGANSITIGSESSAISGSNIAIGRYAKVEGYNVTNAVALGQQANALVTDGVAIGSGSQATVKGDSVEGYDPSTGKASEDTTATWKATKGAVSIGTADGTVTRQINGVAAGTNDTDAVNVAQLKKLEGMKANVDASNIGSNITVAPIYKEDDNGQDVIDQDATKKAEDDARTANENAWGTAIGTGKIEKDNGQLVTGKTVYDALHGGLDDVVFGHDGKDGKDGSIGLVGPKGQDGKDGKTTTIIKTETGAAGVNGKDGKDGITRIYYYDQTNPNDKHTVATLDDGMKYAGDTGEAANVKLDHQLKLSGTTFDEDKKYDGKDWTSDNIAVVSSAADATTGNATMYLKLAKDLKDLHSSTYTTTETTGEGDQKQTTDYTTTVDSTGVTIKSTTTKDGKPETVNGPSMTKDGINGGGKQITNVGDGITKDKDGNYTISETDKKNAANLGDVQTIVDKATKDLTDGANGLNKKANVDASNIGSNITVAPIYQKDEKGQDVIGQDGKKVVDQEATKKAEDDARTANENAWGKAIGTGKVADPTQSTTNDPTKNGSQQLVTGGEVYKALHGGLDDVVFGHDGKDGKDGSIGLVGPKGQDGKDGKTTTIIKTETGAAGVNGKDGKDGITRIYYYDQTNTNDKHTVATLDDGMKYVGDAGEAANVKLDHQLKLSGTTFDKDKKYDEKDWTSDNIAVVSNAADATTGDATMYLKLNKDLNLTDKGFVRFGDKNSSTTLDASGLTIKSTVTKEGKTEVVSGPSMTKDGIDGGSKAITNIGSGIEKDDKGNYTDKSKSSAANIGDVQTIVNDAKKELTDGTNGLNSKANVDASNIGENLKDADGKDASDEEVKKNKDAWASAIGTDEVKEGNKQLVTSDAVAKELAKKADKSYVDQELGKKADKTYVDEKLDTKANKSDVYTKDETYSKTEVDSKVTNITNGLNGKAGKDLDNISDKGKTVIHNIAKDAVEVVAGTNTTVTTTKGTDTTPMKYAVNVEGKGKVASGDTGLISGDTLYQEVHVDKDGSYIKSGNTVGQNLSSLDTGLKTTSDLIHTNDKGDTIQIGGNSTATKIDVSGEDANGNTTGRVITGVVSDANDPSSAANVGYVNGLTAANTQQIYRDMNNAYSRLDTNINRAAAGSNALAALHPLDFDPADKASFAVGYGHYHNANAAAVGAFYQPNANTMVNMGISLGNGDPGFNAGVSFKIGKGSAYNGVSKAEMAQTIHDQAAEISTIKANDAAKDKRIDALEKENQEMKKQIQEILARLNG